MNKITFFIYSLRAGGAERVIAQLSARLKEKFLVDILTIEGGNEFCEFTNNQENINHICIEAKSILGSLVSIFRYLKESDTKIFISNVWPLTILGSWMSLFFPKKHFIAIEHCNIFEEFKYKGSIFIFFQKLSIKLFYSFNTKIIAVSKGVRDSLVDVAPSLNKKIKVIYNPTRSEKISNHHSLENDYKIFKSFNAMKLIAVGTHNQQKNYPFLIKTLKEIHLRGIRFLCYIIGEGALIEDTKDLINRVDLQENIKCIGYKKDPREYMNIADVFVLPSLAEGFGLVIVEALQCGLTPVVTDCPSGPAEIIKNKYGKLVKLDDTNDFVTKILEAHKNKIMPELLKERSKDFDEDVISANYLKLLNGLI